jgi:carbamoyl-phosphate synthase large subunit
MKELTIVVTGVGAPGIIGTYFSLKNNYDNRAIKIIGTDAEPEVVGKYICDDFYTIPKASNTSDYLEALVQLCVQNKVDIILPQNTMELEVLAQSKKIFEDKGVKIIVSSVDAINYANNKYNLMKVCETLKIPVGEFYLTNNFEDLKIYAKKLGWPKKKFVVKPPISNGQRGVRIIDESFDSKHSFYQNKPSDLVIKMNNLCDILGSNFPELIVTEYLPGLEYTVDVFKNEEENIIIPRKRNKIRSGISFEGQVEKHEDIIKHSLLISQKLNLEYCFGFQFKLDQNGVPKILECNPRVQGTMVLSTIAGVNIIYNAIKSILNEEIPKQDIDWNAKLLRYWGAIGISKGVVRI